MLISGMLVTGAPPSVAASRAMSLPLSSSWVGGGERGLAVSLGGEGPARRTMAAAVECSSRPQKKATAHHRKTRPKKTQPWDVRRKGPTAYAPLPKLPPDWSLASSSDNPQEDMAPSATAS
ncbi:unnamed protein product [Spirodela intermedia]|uniref:Uncharacterized protein n=2 Tax=Spirodela intermedia TaxID=51605 RepID=A0A7I8K7V0_SPIIN|nr:unnamed protein product [Spirodela intermedia]CAA6657637.1 unnamed protein product [Spirodela intermedia]CAA7393724.1 unnamed protein product [Spirodela intermedia]